jgi:hypothetical protein
MGPDIMAKEVKVYRRGKYTRNVPQPGAAAQSAAAAHAPWLVAVWSLSASAQIHPLAALQDSATGLAN